MLRISADKVTSLCSYCKQSIQYWACFVDFFPKVTTLHKHLIDALQKTIIFVHTGDSILFFLYLFWLQQSVSEIIGYCLNSIPYRIHFLAYRIDHVILFSTHTCLCILFLSVNHSKGAAQGTASQQVPVISCASSSESEWLFSVLSVMFFFII